MTADDGGPTRVRPNALDVNPLHNALAGSVMFFVWGILLSLFPRYESVSGPWALLPEALSISCFLVAATAALGTLNEEGFSRFLKGLGLGFVFGLVALAVHAHTVGLKHSNTEVFIERIVVYLLMFTGVACSFTYVPDLIKQPIPRDKITSMFGYIITVLSVVSAIISIYAFVYPPKP
jgi:hypothetical protein